MFYNKILKALALLKSKYRTISLSLNKLGINNIIHTTKALNDFILS